MLGLEGGYVIVEVMVFVVGLFLVGRGKVLFEFVEIKGVKKVDLKVVSCVNIDNEGGVRVNDGWGYFSKFGGRVDVD